MTFPVDIYPLICRQGPCSKFGQISFGCAAGFRGFQPLFWHRLPLFSRGRCMRRQATAADTGGNFLRAEKKPLLMWVLLNLISSLFLNSASHNFIIVVKVQDDVSKLCCWCWVFGSWQLWIFLACLYLCFFKVVFRFYVCKYQISFCQSSFQYMFFYQIGFYQSFGLFSMYVFTKLVFVGVLVRDEKSRHTFVCPVPTRRSTLQRWNPHKIDNHHPHPQHSARFYCTRNIRKKGISA